MQGNRRLPLLVLVLLAVAGVVFLWNRGPRESHRGAEAAMGTAQETGTRHDPDPASSSDGTPDGEQPAQFKETTSARRAPVDSALFSGWVVDERGNPIADAHVTLVALLPRDVAWEPAWQEGEWGALDSPRAETKSKSDGGFSFEHWVGPEEGSDFVLSAGRVGYLRTTRPFSFPVPDGTTLRLTLVEAPPLLVTVLDQDEAQVAGALVEQFGLVPSAKVRGLEGAEPATQLRRYIHSKGVTDGSGQVRLPRMAGEQVFVASLGESVSLPWRGEPGEKVTLHLGDSFRLAGTIELPDWSDLHYQGERRLRVSVVEGGVERNLATLRDVRAGAWGPLRLPLARDTTYWVYLEGSPIVPVRTPFASPEPGAEIRVDLHAKRGRHLWVVAKNQEQEVILNSKATVRWTDAEGRAQFVSRRAMADGYIQVWSYPPEEALHLDVRIEAPGYVTEEFPDQKIDFADEEGSLELRLRRAGRIAGRCSFHGSPVEDFSVLAISTKDRWVYSKQEFWGRSDGAFTLDDVVPGTVLLLASSADHPPGDPITVSVTEGQTTRVELELAAGAKRSGVVRNGSSGEPVAGARIRQLTTLQLSTEDWWGPEVLSDEEGLFEIGGMKEGVSFLHVSAPGLSPQATRITDSLREDAPPLQIELFPPQSLEVQLEGLESGDYGAFTAEGLDSSDSLPLRGFPPSGLLRYDAVETGRYRYSIDAGFPSSPDESLVADLDLRPGGRSSLRFAVGGPNRLTIRYRAAPDTPAPPGPWAAVLYRSAQGLEVTRWCPLDGAGGTTAEGVEGDSVWVQIYARDGTILAAAGGSFRRGELTLDLDGSAEPFRLEVVDGEGRPVTGVDVWIRDPATSAPGPRVLTDAEGVAQLHGLPRRMLHADLFHESRGIRIAAPFDATKREAKLVLKSGAAIELAVTSGGVALPGAEGVFLDAGQDTIVSRRRADSAGHLSWTQLSPGSYSVQVRSPGHWSETIQVSSSEDPAPTPLVLRGLGDLRVQLVSEEGDPLPGVELMLKDLTSGAFVADWVAAGLVEHSARKTNPRGETLWRKLPEGDYTLRVAGPAGIPLGSVHVLPGTEVTMTASGG